MRTAASRRARRGRTALVTAVAGAILATAPSPALASPCGPHPWCDPGLDAETRTDLLLGAMTQREKYELMGGQTTQEVNSLNEAIPRLGIPEVRFTDGPAGIRQSGNLEGKTTEMPAPLALAAAFDPALARRYGASVADEARRKGRNVLLAPTINLMRTPLNGRTFEAFGEDPWLMSRTAVGYVDGVQSQGVVANPKHFAANNQEGQGFVPPSGGAVGSRQTVNAIVDDRTLREIYLPHFEATVKEAKAGTIMLAYNRINGQYAAENGPLVEGILKGEWGFDGFALSDYGATRSTTGSANNGLDLELPQAAFYRPELLEAAVEASQISRDAIDDHVRRLLRVMFRYGMFEEGARRSDLPIDERGHAGLAREVAESGSVLLKNAGGALPLDERGLKSVALIGPFADANQGGGGSAQVRPFFEVTPRKALTDRLAGKAEVRFDDGSNRSRAAGVAKGADVAIVVVADSQDEFGDKTCLTLEGRCQSQPNPSDPDALVEAVAEANPNTVVVLEAGGPVLLPWLPKVRALLQSWYPGQVGGEAIASLLFGDVNPSGRLPVTFPKREADLPTTTREQYPGVAENARYSEGVFVGYRHFDRRAIEPEFPFGFGLSYTSFAYDDLRVTPGEGDRVTVSAEVRNTGRRAGAETAQLYVGIPEPRPGVEQPPRQLKAYQKVSLAPGERRRVSMELDARSFAFWDTQTRGWRVPRACHSIEVGPSSRDLPLRAELARGGAAGCRAGSGGPDAGSGAGAGAPPRRCTSRRRITVHVPRSLRRRTRTVAVRVAGRRTTRLSGRRARRGIRIDLRGRPRQLVRVTLQVRLRDGQGRTIRRAFRTCTRKRGGR